MFYCPWKPKGEPDPPSRWLRPERAVFLRSQPSAGCWQQPFAQTAPAEVLEPGQLAAESFPFSATARQSWNVPAFLCFPRSHIWKAQGPLVHISIHPEIHYFSSSRHYILQGRNPEQAQVPKWWCWVLAITLQCKWLAAISLLATKMHLLMVLMLPASLLLSLYLAVE